jgi:hypothetical protein
MNDRTNERNQQLTIYLRWHRRISTSLSTDSPFPGQKETHSTSISSFHRFLLLSFQIYDILPQHRAIHAIILLSFVFTSRCPHIIVPFVILILLQYRTNHINISFFPINETKSPHFNSCDQIFNRNRFSLVLRWNHNRYHHKFCSSPICSVSVIESNLVEVNWSLYGVSIIKISSPADKFRIS